MQTVVLNKCFHMRSVSPFPNNPRKKSNLNPQKGLIHVDTNRDIKPKDTCKQNIAIVVFMGEKYKKNHSRRDTRLWVCTRWVQRQRAK